MVNANNTVVEYDDKLVRITYKGKNVWSDFIFLHSKVTGCPRSPAGETRQRGIELLGRWMCMICEISPLPAILTRADAV